MGLLVHQLRRTGADRQSVTNSQRRSNRRRARGASAPEYAIGVAVLAVALNLGVQAVEQGANERYDQEQSLIGTPVTDLGAAPTTTTAAQAPAETLPPRLETTTTVPTLTLTARGMTDSGTNWWIAFTVTSSASTGTVTATAMPSGLAGTCTLSGGTCSGTITDLKGHDGDQVVTAVVGSTVSNPVAVAVS